MLLTSISFRLRLHGEKESFKADLGLGSGGGERVGGRVDGWGFTSGRKYDRMLSKVLKNRKRVRTAGRQERIKHGTDAFLDKGRVRLEGSG
jgi:hypothetical protein